MIRPEEWVDIVALHRQGLSIKAISRRMGISRNTVRAAPRQEVPPKYVRPPKPSKLDPFKDYPLTRLSEFPELSAAALFEEITGNGLHRRYLTFPTSVDTMVRPDRQSAAECRSRRRLVASGYDQFKDWMGQRLTDSDTRIESMDHGTSRIVRDDGRDVLCEIGLDEDELAEVESAAVQRADMYGLEGLDRKRVVTSFMQGL